MRESAVSHATMNIVVLLLSISHLIDADGPLSKSKIRKFPEEFRFGATTSAYQVEGAFLNEGKSLSIWDKVTHKNPSPIKDGSTGDVAANSYNLYRRDIEIAKQLGLDFYKFSISWPRILPQGFLGKINLHGVTHYHHFINELLSHDISPMVTIYHWDLPHSIQRLGGWINPLIVQWFSDYAKILFDLYGDRVKHWITVNEPKEICFGGYGSAEKPPMLNMTGVAEYICGKHVLLAHAKVYQIYDEQYRKKQNGLIGISIGFTWYEPSSDTYEDGQAAVDAKMFEWGQFAHPIFSSAGDYPFELKNNVGLKSTEQGLPRSRLPELTRKEVNLIKGSADFLGVNTFTTKMAYRDASLDGMYPVPSYLDDMDAVLIKDQSWVQSASSWLQEVPWGFRKLLLEIKKLYDNPPMIITANGFSTTGGLVDENRIQYMRGYLNALLDAMEEGCDIKGYSVYTLIDGFEWMQGYSEKFGITEVDFTVSNKTRTLRKSAFIYKEIIRSKALDLNFEPEKFLF